MMWCCINKPDLTWLDSASSAPRTWNLVLWSTITMTPETAWSSGQWHWSAFQIFFSFYFAAAGHNICLHLNPSLVFLSGPFLLKKIILVAWVSPYANISVWGVELCCFAIGTWVFLLWPNIFSFFGANQWMLKAFVWIQFYNCQ